MGGSRQGEKREKRKHSEFSLTVIISTLRDGWRGVKKRREVEKESEAKCVWRGLWGACGFLSDPPVVPPYPKKRGARGE